MSVKQCTKCGWTILANVIQPCIHCGDDPSNVTIPRELFTNAKELLELFLTQLDSHDRYYDDVQQAVTELKQLEQP